MRTLLLFLFCFFTVPGFAQDNIKEVNNPSEIKVKSNLEVPPMPEGYVPPEIPEGLTPPSMPEGYVPPKIPEGITPPSMPEGFVPPEMPEGGHQMPSSNLMGPTPEEQEELLFQYGRGILEFFSFIEIHSDGNIIITDNIKLGLDSPYKTNFERNFPISYPDANGNLVHNSINVLSATFNNIEIPFITEVKDDNIVVDVSYPSEYFTEDVNIISISYRVANNLSFKNGETEMFWQAIGNGWRAKVNNLGAAVIFVKGTEVVENIAFITKNPQETAFKVATDVEGNIGFIADRGLVPYESFTIYLKWKGDVINQSKAHFSSEIIYEQYGLLIVLFVIIFILLLYYAFSSLIISKDKDFFTNGFANIRNTSPLCLRYISRKRFDVKVNSISFLNMLIKSFSKITKHNDELKITADLKAKKKLDITSIFLFSFLFSKKKSEIIITDKEKSKIKSLFKNIPFFILIETELFYFKQNIKFILTGLVLSIFAIVNGSLMSNFPVYISIRGIMLLLGSFGVFFIGLLLYKTYKRIHKETTLIFALLSLGFIVSSIFAFNCFASIYYILNIYTAIAIFAIPLMILIAHLFIKRSLNTTKMINEGITGFKNFILLPIDEKISDKTNYHSFDKYLPYAMAFDEEAQFNDKYIAKGHINLDNIDYLPSENKNIPDLSLNIDKLFN